MKKKIIFHIFLVTILFIVLVLDNFLFSLTQTIRSEALDKFFSVFLLFQQEPYFEIWIVFFVFLLLFKKRKRDFLKFLISFFITAALVLLLKKVIARPRPFSAGKGSFPSGHAALLFVTFHFMGGRKKIFWYFFVFILVFTRVYFGFHFYSDIIASFLISELVSFFVKKCKSP
ncbi:MAG: phosphatase PAP2 family protein [Candidatus Pacearchaeota archaeon]|nr:phosphatase PAP2 family protein [Candidatus Pacearchaeota archaeon]